MDFKGIFNGEALTLEQFAERTKKMKLEDLSSGAYVDKGKYDSDTNKLLDDLAEAKNTIASLEASKGDVDALQAELDRYKQAEAEREKAEREATEAAKLLERFNAVKGENQFSSDYAEKGVLEAFRNALADPQNIGRGDAELFADLTRDKEGVFASKNPSVNMGGIGHVDPDAAPTNLAGALKERYEMKG